MSAAGNRQGGVLGRERLVVDQALQGLNKASEFIKYGMQASDQLAVDLASMEQDPDKVESRIANSKAAMLDFCAMERDMKQLVEATEYMMSMLLCASRCSVQPESAAPAADLIALLDARLLELNADCTNDDLTSHPLYTALERHVNDVVNPPGEDGAVDASLVQQQQQEIRLDDDIAMTQPRENTRCPYTGREMVRPVRNRHCRHNYERDGVLELIRHRGERAKCPVSGCINEKQLVEADLEDNVELKQQIERANRRRGGANTGKKGAGKS